MHKVQKGGLKKGIFNNHNKKQDT